MVWLLDVLYSDIACMMKARCYVMSVMLNVRLYFLNMCIYVLALACWFLVCWFDTFPSYITMFIHRVFAQFVALALFRCRSFL